MATVWTKAAKDKLTRLRSEGYSYATIAAMMGTTKNVLLGHVWREKIKAGHKPENGRSTTIRKAKINEQREAWAQRRLEAVTLTLCGYSNAAVAKQFGANVTQISRWRTDPETRARAEAIASRLPKVGNFKVSETKRKMILSGQERARRREHMRQVSCCYWDKKRAAQ